VLILGEEEWERGEVVVKDLASGEQRTLPRSGIAGALRALLAHPEESAAR